MSTSSTAIDTAQVTRLPAMFFSQAERLRDRKFLWAKSGDVYRPLTWRHVAEQVNAAAAGFKSIGVKQGDRVIIVSENRPDFFIADLAIMSIGAVAVPTYTTNTANNHLHIINDSGARLVVVSTPLLARHVIAAAMEAYNKVAIYVVDEPEKAFKSDVDVRTWADLLKAGKGAGIPSEMATLKRDDLCCLIYTSGTGGLPKGVMLSHGNILANCYGATVLVKTLGIDNEVFLSFLRTYGRTIFTHLVRRRDLLCRTGGNAQYQFIGMPPDLHDGRAAHVRDYAHAHFAKLKAPKTAATKNVQSRAQAGHEEIRDPQCHDTVGQSARQGA